MQQIVCFRHRVLIISDRDDRAESAISPFAAFSDRVRITYYFRCDRVSLVVVPGESNRNSKDTVGVLGYKT